MARRKFRYGVVADAREVEPDLAGGKVLDRRVRQRDDLPVVAELIHLAEALVEIEQLFDAAQPRGDVAEPRRDAIHLLEELVGKDVTVDIDDRVIGHRRSPSLNASRHARASGHPVNAHVAIAPGGASREARRLLDRPLSRAMTIEWSSPVHKAQNFVRSGPFKPSIARASFGVATW